MKQAQYNTPEALRSYVNSIIVMESSDPNGTTQIPLYADGYPGIMFQNSSNGFYMMPKGKALSELFLYGQTVEPISLDTSGAFKFTVFQLYPFVSKYLIDVDPKSLNGECYDLFELQHLKIEDFALRMRSTSVFEEQVAIMTELIQSLIEHHQVPQDDRIQKAISIILENKGQTSIKDVREQIYVTERTFERQFLSQVGLSAKQFAKIIQFKSSLEQLSNDNYIQLLDIGLDSGFADQSHFIRCFKKYTAKTPSEFIKENMV